jgi:hypothetical protein
LDHQRSLKESNFHKEWKKSNNKSLKENVEKTTKRMNLFQIVGMDGMEQRCVVLFLQLKALQKKAIHHGFVAVLLENAVSYSSVTRFCREDILGLSSADTSSAIIAQT